MPEGNGVFSLDTRDLRATAEVVGRSRIRANYQDAESPNYVPNVRNISFLDPYRSPSDYQAIYDRAVNAVRTHVSSATNVMAGNYGLVISAFASVDRTDVVTINVGHGNFLSNNTFAVNGQLDIATRAGLTYIASLVSQIRQANPGAHIVLMGAYNGGTIANLASITLGIPAITMISNPLTEDVVNAGVSYMQGLSQQDPSLVSPEVANNPFLNPEYRQEYTPFQTIESSLFFYETLVPSGTEAYSYDDSLWRGLSSILESAEGVVSYAKATLVMRQGLHAVHAALIEEHGMALGTQIAGALVDAVARGDHDAAYAIAGGNEGAVEWLGKLSGIAFIDDALIQNQADLSDMIDALGEWTLQFESGDIPPGLTTDQWRALLEYTHTLDVSYYAKDETRLGFLRGALIANPNFINQLVEEDGFGSVTSIIAGSSFLRNNSIFGKFSPEILASLRGGADNRAITDVVQQVEGGHRFDRLLWEFTDYVRSRGAEPNRGDIELFYSEVIGFFDNHGGASGLRKFLGEAFSEGFKNEFFEHVAEISFARDGNSPGARPMEDTCFVPGTTILLADGSTKPVEELAVGDKVASFPEERVFGSLAAGEVAAIVRRTSPRIVTLNALRCTFDHQVLAEDGSFRPADSFKAGDRVIGHDGRPVELTTVESEEGEHAVIALSIAPFATLVADGLRVHNEARCSIFAEFFRVDENLAIKSDIRPDGTIVLEYIDGRNVKTGERIIGDRATIDRVYEEYGDLTGFEVRDEDGVYRPSLPPGMIEELFFFEEDRFERAEKMGSAGNAIGSLLGERIAGNDAILGMGLKATFGTLLENMFEAASIGHLWGELPLTELEILGNIEIEFAGNLTGAVSSYLIAQLFAEIGIDGIPGEVLQNSAGTIVSTIAQNIINGVGAFEGLGGAFGSSIGSFVGTRLASELVSFDSIGGQIGSSLGSSLGSIFSAELIGAIFPKLLSSLGWAGGPVGAAIGAFVGFLIGGLIGSLFGGTPRSGADVAWNEEEGLFEVTNVYARKGGSKELAETASTNVAETLNSVVFAMGGVLVDPAAVQTGNYGMRGKDLVYRPYSTSDKDAITAKFRGDNALSNLVNHGLTIALTDADFEVWGGSVVMKRAFYQYVDGLRSGAKSLDQAELFGNFASAAAFERVFTNLATALELGSVSGNTVEARELAIALARGHELQLDRRGRSDWFGGFGYLQATSGVAYAGFSFGLQTDALSSQMVRELTYGEFLLPELIATSGQTRIRGTAGNDVIDARGGRVDNTIGMTVDGVLQEGLAQSGQDFAATSQTVSFGAGSTQAEMAIAVVADASIEMDERFLIGASNATDLFIVDRQADAVIVEAGGQAHFTVGDSYVSTHDDFLVFRVALSKSVGVTVAASLGATDGDDNPIAGSFEVSANGIDGWQQADTVTYAAGATQMYVRISTAGLVPPLEPNEAGELPERVRGTVAEVQLHATVVEGSEHLAAAETAPNGYGRVIEDGEQPRNFVWIDDVVVHEELGGSLSVRRSRAAPAGSLTIASLEDIKVDIAISATLEGGAGNDTVHASDLGDNVLGGGGNDNLYGGRLDDWLLGGDGDDRLDAGSATAGTLGGDGNYLNGGAGNDQLFGREGSDWLEGGEGVDVLRAGGGGDILSGGADDGDELYGGAGDDTYILRRGDGTDLADDQDAAAPAAPSSPEFTDAIAERFAKIHGGSLKRDWLGTTAAVSAGQAAGGEDAIAFGNGISINDVRLSRSADGKDLIVAITEIGEDGTEVLTGDKLTVRGWFSDPFKRVEWLKFVDGTEIRIGDVTSFIVGTPGDDVLIGTDGNDFIYGGSGNDKLHLLAGNDIGLGGTGDDLVSGGADDDLVVGGLGNDDLIGGSGHDAISGDSGHDSLYGSQGDDILSGGRDNDLVVGGAGNDRFKFARGDGHDVMFDDYSDDWTVVWQGGNWLNGYVYDPATSEVIAPDGTYVRKNFGTVGEPDLRWVGQFDYDETTGQFRRFTPPVGASTTVSDKGEDTIEFALDINLQDVMFERVAGTDDLRVAVGRSNAETSLSAARDSITLRDWYDNPGSIETFAFYAAGEIDVSATGYNLIAGTDGEEGAEGSPLRGTAGRDWMTGAGGGDHLAGGEADDIVSGGAGSDHLKGEAGNDVLYGGSDNDVLDGGLGADILSGGAGLDTASYASSANAVTVYLTNAALNQGDARGDVYDSIENLIGSGAGDVLGGDDGDNEITGGKGSDYMLGGLGNDTYVWNIGDGADVIEDVEFIAETIVSAEGDIADGYEVIWTQMGDPQGAQQKTEFFLSLVNSTSGEVIFADTVYTTGGLNDQPDVRYWHKRGWQRGFLPATDGSVSRVAYDEQQDAGEADAIEMGAGISLADLTFERSGNDLKIFYVNVEDGNNGDGLAVGQSQDANLLVRNHFLEKNRVEYLIFADGLAVSLANVIAADSSGVVNGSDLDELIVGQRGVRDDTLAGGAGNDVISGGEGNDTLRGGDGDDVLEGGRGADVLDGGAHSQATGGETDLLRGDTVRYATSAAGVSVDLASTGSQSGGDAAGDTLIGIENVTGSVHDDTLAGDDGDNRLDALGGNNTLYGRGGADVLVSGDGADTLDGGAGEDNLSSGGGDDILRGGADNDLLAAGDGADQLFGDDGDDILSAGAGDDRLEGGAGADQLIGGTGDDTLLGGLGADVLAGEEGNDRLQGGADADRYFFAAGFGQDTLIDSEGANEILIDQSIAYDSLWFHRSGDDLVMTVRGSDDRLTIADFFAAENAASIYSVQTATHRLFLGHPDVRNFLDAMQAASPGGAPGAIPASVAALMDRYWHEGTTARPWAEDFELAIDEDTTTGTVAIGAIDHDENISEYRIVGDALHGTATVDATGRFAYAPDLNFNGADSFKIAVLDADGNGREIEVRVGIAPVDDAPVIDGPADGPLAIDEDAPLSDTVTGSVVGRILASEFDGEAIVFTLTDNAGGRFAISIDGVVTVADASRLDHEANESHSITVLVTDAVGSTDERTFTVAINDVNEAPATPALISQDVFVGEGSPGGAVVASFALSDPEGTVPTLVADGNPGNLFEIVGGEVRLAAEVDFETLAGHGFAIGDEDGDGRADIAISLTVHAHDGELRSDDADTITFFVEDVNEAPSALLTSGLLTGFAERDRVPAGTTLPAITVAVLSVADPDLAGLANARYVYTVDDPRFEIVGNQLRLRQGVAFDYENEDQVTVAVTATDQGVDPQSIARELTFAIENRDDYLEGTPNPDTLIGQANRDIITGLTGDDHIEGLSGNDTLVGNDGEDTILGGAGNDEILGGADDDILYGEAGNDTILGGSGHDVIAGGLGSDTIDAGEGDDAVLGDDDGVVDTIDGGSGVDRLVYTALSRGVTADLSAGIADGDSVTNIEEIEGSAFADALTGDAGDNRLQGGAGDDILSGLAGSDRLEGGAGGDILSGGEGNDLLFGEAGNDILSGDAGSDSLYGGDGTDNLYGGAGDDRLEGGGGNDVMDAGDGNDTYVIDRKSDHDTIFNYDGTGSDIDVLGFTDTFGEIHEHDLWFERQGNDLVVFVIGEDTSVRVTDWYLDVDPEGRANHRLDFLLGGEWVSREADVEALAEFQSNFTRPASVAELDALRADPVYDATVATFFGINAPPTIAGIADQSILEDGTMQLVLTLGDDYTPAAGIAFAGSVLSGASMLGPQGLVVGAVGADGKVTVTLSPAAHVAGTIDLSFTAIDAGGVDATQTLRLTIDPVADTPLITQFSSTPSTSGAAIALSLAVDFPDRDGSETQTVRIAGVPSDVSLNRGSFDAASGQWVLQPADLSGLALLAPTGWSQDLQLTVTALASEGGTYAQASTSTTVVINAPPTNILSGLSVDENAAGGTGIGYLQGVDPDGDALTYELLDDAEGRFTLDPNGFLKVGDGLKLDYEAATSHAVRVRVTDLLGATYERSVSVGVRNVNEAPSVSGDTSRAIFAEPVAAGTVLATFAASDPDGTTPVLQLTSGTNLFAVSGPNIVLKSGAPTTYADALAYANARGVSAGDIDGDGHADVKLGTIEVVASDGSLESGVIRRDVYFENVNDAPDAPSVLQSVLHSETGGGLTPHANKLIAKFSLSDPDGAQPTLVITGGNDNGWFRVAGDSIVFAPDVNLTADYLRAIAGTMGVAASFSSDIDSDGLKELLVANLTLAARDADGLLSQSVSYAVRIEDRNESPQFSLASYAYGIAETVGAYTQVGTAAATDVDGPASALTYGFVGGSTRWDVQLGADVGVSTDGRLLVHSKTGAIYTAGSDAFASSGGLAFDYSLSVTDRNGDSHALTATAGLHIDVSGVNEPHTLIDASDSRDEVEGLEPLTPIFDLRSAMLQDPEGRNMRWQFAGGGTQSADGLWTITSDGKLVLTTGSADYESIITYYETRIVFNPKTFEEEEVTTAHRDPSRATQQLAIEAIDDSIGVVASGVFTATINDVNEGAVLTSSKQYYIQDDQDEDDVFGYLRARDPDTLSTAIGFAIDSSSVVLTESNHSRGDSADVDNSGNPTVYIVNGNELKFEVPDDGEWEGGIKNHPTLGGRWYYQLDYSFDVVMTDPTGLTSRENINVTFLKHGVDSAPPIVFDLDGDGLELVSLSGSNIYFDMDQDDIGDRTGWVAADDGMLVLDRNANGMIDDISEISFLDDVEGATTDLEGLVAFDSNSDGRLDAADERFFEFRIWQDRNQNGVSEAGELLTLPQAGIHSVSLLGDRPDEIPEGPDNLVYGTVEYIRIDGSTGIAGDVFLAFEGSAEVSLAAPVLFDFDGDGETLVGLSKSRTSFDQDGDGDKERTAWFEADDAVLAVDRNKNGVIDDISEISFLSDLEGAKTDLEGLAAYDQNKDGKIDADDIDFAALKLWFDKDSDGITDAGELRSLSEVGIASISLEAIQDETTGKQADGSVIYGKATFVFDDGRTGTLLDTGLAYLANSATHATAVAGAPVEEPEFAATRHSFGRKSKKYYAHSLGGELAISLRKPEGEVDQRAGGIGVFSEMSFANREYAYLDAIVLDLDGDGVETKRHSKTKARFDMNGDGVGDDTGWSSSRDGLLVVDRNENGLIDDGSELSFQLDAPEARSAMQGFAAFDSNGDGLVSVLDERFGELKIWVDSNHDGKTDAGELRSLAEHNISSISIRAAASEDRQKVGRNVLLSTAIFNRTDGSTGTLGNVAFGFKPSHQSPSSGNHTGNGFARRAAFLSALPRTEDLSLADTLHDDFFARFDKGLQDLPLTKISQDKLQLESGGPGRSGQDLPLTKVRAIDALELETISDLEGPAQAAYGADAQRLALLLQDMAAFGAGAGAYDQLRDRQPEHALADIYS